jgi:hypothetical protein
MMPARSRGEYREFYPFDAPGRVLELEPCRSSGANRPLAERLTGVVPVPGPFNTYSGYRWAAWTTSSEPGNGQADAGA